MGSSVVPTAQPFAAQRWTEVPATGLYNTLLGDWDSLQLGPIACGGFEASVGKREANAVTGYRFGETQFLFGNDAFGATLRRGEIQCPAELKLKHILNNVTKTRANFTWHWTVIFYFILPRLYGEAIEPVKDEGSQQETCWPNGRMYDLYQFRRIRYSFEK